MKPEQIPSNFSVCMFVCLFPKSQHHSDITDWDTNVCMYITKLSVTGYWLVGQTTLDNLASTTQSRHTVENMSAKYC